MNRYRQIAVGIAAALGLSLATTAVLAQSPGMGPGMMHRGQGMGHGTGAGNHNPTARHTAMLTRQDAHSSADMGLVDELLASHTAIKRTVTRLPDGIKTVTESDDPKVAQAIKAHVASMSGRLQDGREFNIFSTTLPVIFDNADKIKSVVEITEKGAMVIRTSTDAKVTAALQAHAGEVTELVQEGMAAFHRGMMSRMAMGPGGPRGSPGTGAPQDRSAPATP